MSGKMHKTQKEYAVAKAIYEVLKDEKQQVIQKWEEEHGEINQDNFDAYNEFMDNSEIGMQYRQAFDNLKNAEDNMVRWANEAVIHLATPEQAKDIRQLIEKFVTYEMMPKHRATMIDMAFRLIPR